MAKTPDDIYAARPQSAARHEKIAIITADGTEDQEFFYPYYRFLEEGYQVDVFTPDGGAFKGKNGAGLKQTLKIEDGRPENYALLYIPGGKAPERLKKEEEALAFVHDFCATGRPVIAICHGPQLLAQADVIAGRKIAAWPECEEEIVQAGAIYINGECVHDGQFITGRWPADLPALMRASLEALMIAGHQRPKVA